MPVSWKLRYSEPAFWGHERNKKGAIMKNQPTTLKIMEGIARILFFTPSQQRPTIELPRAGVSKKTGQPVYTTAGDLRC